MVYDQNVTVPGVLIETLWNVKPVHAPDVLSLVCINRNIVECKAGMYPQGIQCFLRINRNIVECKANSAGGIFCKCSVLIETLWNVKIGRKSWLRTGYKVLIETLWNVKNILKSQCKYKCEY